MRVQLVGDEHMSDGFSNSVELEKTSNTYYKTHPLRHPETAGALSVSLHT